MYSGNMSWGSDDHGPSGKGATATFSAYPNTNTGQVFLAYSENPPLVLGMTGYGNNDGTQYVKKSLM